MAVMEPEAHALVREGGDVPRPRRGVALRHARVEESQVVLEDGDDVRATGAPARRQRKPQQQRAHALIIPSIPATALSPALYISA